jgi:hypothetical protein
VILPFDSLGCCEIPTDRLVSEANSAGEGVKARWRVASDTPRPLGDARDAL